MATSFSSSRLEPKNHYEMSVENGRAIIRMHKREAWKQVEDEAIQFHRERIRRINEARIKRKGLWGSRSLLIGSSG